VAGESRFDAAGVRTRFPGWPAVAFVAAGADFPGCLIAQNFEVVSALLDRWGQGAVAQTGASSARAGSI
jgi:hypothetical protein